VNNRESVIRQVQGDGESVYCVDLYENGKLVQTRELTGKNEHYAKDLAENWETGVIKLLTE